MKNSIVIKLIFILAFTGLLSACGQPTKITIIDEGKFFEGLSFGIMQEGQYENLLRQKLLEKGIRTSAEHKEQRGFNHQATFKYPVEHDYLLKFTFRENRPCIIGASKLGYGKLEVLNKNSGRTIIVIEEMGFTEECLGSTAIYGHLFEKLANSLYSILPDLESQKGV